MFYNGSTASPETLELKKATTQLFPDVPLGS